MNSSEALFDIPKKHLPTYLIELLKRCGFDTISSIKNMNEHYVNEMESLINANRFLIEGIDLPISYLKMEKFKFLPGHRILLLKSPSLIQIEETNESKSDILSHLMQLLLNCAKENYGKDPNRKRYHEIVRDFSVYVFLTAGRMCYETISSNLPIPHISTIHAYVHQHKEIVIEGELRCKRLAEYLVKMDAPKTVWISEDGTGIVQRVQYDSSTDQLIGLVLPINSLTGMPIPFSFPASSVQNIEEFMKKEQAKIVYVVMAQSLKENVPPFILQIFGTNNRFTANMVTQRQKYTVQELKKYNIEVLGISSDGDPRLLSSMMTQSKLFDEISSKFIVDLTKIAFIQDTTHIITKLRNRLLALSIILVIGKKQVSVGHLKYLIRHFPKAEHGLVMSDICPDDRQNFGSMEKIMDPKILEMLNNLVPDSEATVNYLQICSEISSSFLDCTISPEERLYRIWHALYFLRIWRQWILESSEYKLQNSFITSNAYICVELNAYFLIHLIVKLRDENKKEQFLPVLFSSQTCESTFRTMRSLTTANWTKVNFSLFELFHSIGRIELLTDIMHNKLKNTGIIFPRIRDKNSKVAVFELPSNEMIRSTINKAKEDAIADAKAFEMELKDDSTIPCKIKVKKNATKIDDLIKEFDLDDECNQQEELSDDLNNPVVPETNVANSYLDIIDKNGDVKKVRKTSIVSMLSTSKNTLSNDRLRRVQNFSNQTFCRRLIFNSEEPEASIFEGNSIFVGDWCVFKTDKKMKTNFSNMLTECLITGVVLGFKLDGKTHYQKGYKGDMLKLKSEISHNVQVLASWHYFNNDGSLSILNNLSHFYAPSHNYLASLQKPITKKTEHNNQDILVFEHFNVISKKMKEKLLH